MSKIAITDYFDFPAEEAEILGDLVGMEVGADTEVLLVWHEHINEAYVSKLPKLRAVQRYGVGYDTLDLNYLIPKGIVCCNNPDYGIDEVADTAVAMIMNMARGVYTYNQFAKGLYEKWQEHVNTRIKRNSDTVVGVIGAGRIGGSVLLKCRGLKFQTAFYDPYKERGHEKMLGAQRTESLEELLEIADIISIHTPLNQETRGMIGAAFVQKMKPGASIVNTARGGLFESLDLLYDALVSEKIYQLGIDVLPDEPPKAGKLLDAWRSVDDPFKGRLIINPHTSYYSQRAYTELRRNAAINAMKLYEGKRPANLLSV